MPEQQQPMTKQLAREQLNGWRAMMQLRPEDSEAIQNCAACLFTLGESAEAMQLYVRAYEMNPRLQASP